MSKQCSVCGKEIIVGTTCMDCMKRAQEEAAGLNSESGRTTAARKKKIKDRITITLSILIPLILICSLVSVVMYNRAQEKKKEAQELLLNSLAVKVEGERNDYYIFDTPRYQVEITAQNLFDIETKSNSKLIETKYTEASLRAQGGYKEISYYLKSNKNTDYARDEYFSIILNKNDEIICIGYYYAPNSKLTKNEIQSNLLKILSDEFQRDPEFLNNTINTLGNKKYSGWIFKDLPDVNYVGFFSEVPTNSDYMDDYTLSDNGYRRFTTKSNIFYKWFIDNASEYGWTVNRYATKKNATQKDRLLGISHYVDSNMETGNGDKVYLRVFCDIDSAIVQVEFYAYDKYLNKDTKKMLIRALFEDFVTDYTGDNLKSDTWSMWTSSNTQKFDDFEYKGICIGVEKLDPMPVSSLYSSAKDFMTTSNGGFSFKAHISGVNWGNSSVSYGKSYYSDPTVYMELIFTVMDSQGRNLGTLKSKVDINSSSLTDYLNYKGKEYEFIFVCDSSGNLIGLPQKVK